MNKERHFEVALTFVPIYLKHKNGINSLACSFGTCATWHEDGTWSLDIHLWIINIWFGWTNPDENAERAAD